jgi:hypothetical protein
LINIVMELAGQFFLCMRAQPCVSQEGEQGVMFALREPAPAAMFPDGLQAAWFGAQAQAFFRAHADELRPGRGLRVILQRLVAREGVIRSRVHSCELLPLPPSWQKGPQQPTTQAQPV